VPLTHPFPSAGPAPSLESLACLLVGADGTAHDAFTSISSRFLDATGVERVLEEMQRLMKGRDVREVLLADPSW
jgi:hypothetical protein